LKGIAIGLSNNSKEILKRLKKTEFVKDIYIAGPSKEDGKENELIQVQKPREILLKKWPKIDLIIFIGSIAASIRIINPFLTSKDQDPGVIVIDNKCSKIVPLIGLHQSNTQNIAFQIANLLGGEIIETNNSNDQSLLNLDAFGNQWGWKRSGKINDWSKLVIKQAKNEEIFCKQLSGNSLWKTSESGEIINQINEKETEIPDSTFHVSIFENHETSWHPPVLWIGIGCERNTSKELIANSLNNFLESGNLSQQSIAGFATIDIKKVNQDHRRKAKAINFGIIYGISQYGLAKQINVSNYEAEEFLNSYFAKFPEIKVYMDNTIKFCRKSGYVNNIFGRRSHFNGINDKNFNVRNFQERAAINAPIQGSASEVMRLAMIRLDKKLSEEKNSNSKMLLQIHDELIFEIPKKDEKVMIKLIEKEMTSVAKSDYHSFSTPLTVDINVGDNWGMLH